MITAAITTAVAFILNLFGIKPGPYLIGVAVGVKIVIVGLGVLLGARFVRRREAKLAAQQAATAPDAGDKPSL